MGLVEEEDQLGLFHVAHFRQLFVQVAQQPEQEDRVQARRLHEFVGGQHVDDAASLGVGAHQVGHIEHGLAEELLGPCDSSVSRLRWIAPTLAADTLP